MRSEMASPNSNHFRDGTYSVPCLLLLRCGERQTVRCHRLRGGHLRRFVGHRVVGRGGWAHPGNEGES